jgi:hypothetical protein
VITVHDERPVTSIVVELGAGDAADVAVLAAASRSTA